MEDRRVIRPLSPDHRASAISERYVYEKQEIGMGDGVKIFVG